MNAIAMQTSALDAENDLLEVLPRDQTCQRECLSITGKLVSRPIVRTHLARDGITSSPVLCLELVTLGAGHLHVYAEQPYPVNGRKDAEAKAASMPKGMCVTVFASGTGLRLSLPHVQSITPSRPS